MRTYLKKANLSGFRTIREVSLDLNAGLNIIIGKNGTGKTNCLSFLKMALDMDYKSLAFFHCTLEFSGKANYTIQAGKSLERFKENSKFRVFDLDEDVKLTLSLPNNSHYTGSLTDVSNAIPKDSYDSVQFIPHGIDFDHFNKAVNSPFSFSVDTKTFVSEELYLEMSNISESMFVSTLMKHLFLQFFRLEENSRVAMARFLEQQVLIVFNQFVSLLNQNISQYLPIHEVRLSPSYKVYEDVDNGLLKFEGLVFEYHINGSWLPYSSLSDGTKRLFYIYAEVITSAVYRNVIEGFPAENKIILLEEPELGVHPTQLHLLMNFLQDASIRNQIVITTHSPQVLDVVSSTELENINICSFDAERGTVIRKLNDKQIEKAQKYLQEEMFLSDYWVHSNLEH